MVSILQMPGNVNAVAIAIAFAAGGSVKNVKTTPLLSAEEGVEALRKVRDVRLSACNNCRGRSACLDQSTGVAFSEDGRGRI